MGDEAQIHALREELSDEAISVLVGAALPRAVRVTEVDVHVQFGAERLVYWARLTNSGPASPSLPTTLERIRNVLGDDGANVVVQWGPGNAKTVHHVVQSATDFVTIPGPGLTPSNTCRPGTTIGSA